MRKLVFERLDARLCLALGDVVTDAADLGEFSVSYKELDRQSSAFVATFTEPDGYLFVANSESGSGRIFTLAKTDLTGAPDLSFGNGGLVQFTDPAIPHASISHAVKLADGGYLLRTNAKSLISLMKLKPDGSLDAEFGTGGVQRQVSNTDIYDIQIAADRDDGFFVLESNARTFQSVLTHYLSAGQIDTDFGKAGSVTTTRLYNSQVAIDAAGQITVVGLDTLSGLDIVAYRFLADGTVDSDFGTNGMARLPHQSPAPQIELVDDVISVLALQSSIADGTETIRITRYNSDLTVDTSFGDKGTAQIEVTPSASYTTVTRTLSDASGVTFVRAEMLFGAAQRTLLTAVKLTDDVGLADLQFALPEHWSGRYARPGRGIGSLGPIGQEDFQAVHGHGPS